LTNDSSLRNSKLIGETICEEGNGSAKVKDQKKILNNKGTSEIENKENINYGNKK
jgi:hypothetical protein